MKDTVVDRLRRFGAQSRQALLFSAVVGVLVGAAVALFDWVTRERLLDSFEAAPIAVQVVAPLAGLALAALALRLIAGGASPASSDEYIKNFHERDEPLDLRPVLGRVLAGVATLGFGGALGFEGPSLYIGASIGSGIQQRWRRHFSREDTKLLMVAGAAAGVAAIFKSPATGAIFALEVPYQDDNASRLLLPALLAAAVSYLTFVMFAGTTPLFAVAGSPPFDLRDLGGAVVLGVVCGIGARGFAHVVRYAKKLSTLGHPAVRVVLAGTAMAGLYGLSYAVYGHGYSFGAGYSTIEWVTQPNQLLGLIVLLFVIRMTAVAATVAGGGVGGLFVPLVVAGALAGKAIGVVLGDPTSSLFPVLGVAAFLGAGYRTPLAGVVFVAETTGQPGFVVPGLLASVAAQLMMGGVSVSAYQRGSRVGHPDDPVVLVNDVADRSTAPETADTTVADYLDRHPNATRVVPVTNTTSYVGVITAAELQSVSPEQRARTTLGDLARHDWPTVRPDWAASDAAHLQTTAGVDTVVVTDSNGRYLGTFSANGDEHQPDRRDGDDRP